VNNTTTTDDFPISKEAQRVWRAHLIREFLLHRNGACVECGDPTDLPGLDLCARCDWPTLNP
jgi:hypothetical protein